MFVKSGRIHTVIHILLLLYAGGWMAYLAVTVFLSGYGYTFWGDELVHANITYLLAHGYLPYKQFFMYASCLFNTVLIPFFGVFGFTFAGIYKVKIVMIGIFILRLLAGCLLLKKYSTASAGILFVFLTLLDPFTVFSGMQIRPDNLMYTLYLAGLWLIFSALRSRKPVFWFTGGIVFSAAEVVLIKTAPAYAVTILSVCIYLAMRKRWRETGVFVISLILPVLLFCLYFISRGYFPDMVRALVTDAKIMTGSLWNPVRYGFFYKPDNIFLFGVMGKPLSWHYAVILPYAGAFAALFVMILKAPSAVRLARLIILLSLAAQWLFLWRIQTAFIQYYQALNTFLVIALSAGIGELLKLAKKFLPLYAVCIVLLLAGMTVISRDSAGANLIRSQMRADGAFPDYEKIWQRIPPGMAVYPSFLFRPPVSGMPFGLFIPEVPDAIQKQYPDPLALLSAPAVRYVYMSDYELSRSNGNVTYYIRENFTKDADIEGLWRRK